MTQQDNDLVVTLKEEIMDQRRETMRLADLDVNVCKICTLRKPYSVDQQSPACKTCPIQQKLNTHRSVLETTLIELRSLRG